MSQGNPSCLRFSLEESVWFQKGQEVSELISISLDPNITIQESDQYVTIQGALELAGEYKRSDAETAGDEEVFAGAKFVQAVEEREEGTCEFQHYFPVDITIPNNRIQSIYDIDVAVESFDYVLPERSCMKLTANLTITGLYGDQQHLPVQEWQEEVEVEELEPVHRSTAAVEETEEEAVNQEEWPAYQEKQAEEEEAEPVYDFAEEEHREEEHQEEHQEEQSEPKEVFVPFEAEARKQPETDEVQLETLSAIEEKQEKKDEKPAESTPEISFASQRSEEEPPTAQEIYQMTEALESDSPSYEKKPEEMAVQESPEEEESSSSEQEAKKKKFSKKKSMSLTEFFARKEEEEEHVKLKVCIVQNGDTIDAIAERYEIPAQQLLRVNHLEINQDIYEGQVLYIPVAVAH
ncbi:stage VI sporulation protein D [Bacillus sp. ISL-47]|uniref:stage VI sporulation protein D n=1 Tax=Bacillus sp. ISL-47 TaxID=2819130 RepID=UPI001BE52F8D|nr:stage VI sporulation protein D [Bacillus sp. ISL-47]MBT2688104.1 stage VI sporulation protein D [Bacillus sp. ISL-47]MBT2707638.1 stage VI sporulation protein D [Pseudomonas sp. ISL-84]